MMLLSLAILLVAGLTNVNGECFRHDIPCLEYTVVQTHEGIEERVYPPTVWMSATAEASDKMDISRPLMKQFYAYMAGGNVKGARVHMMIPVRTKKVVDGKKNIYTISVPIMTEQGKNPPMPSNSNITVTYEPEIVYVTRAFGGYIRQDEVWDNEADLLKSAMSKDDSVDTSFYYMSIYDGPYIETGRLNEVWMVKREN